MYWFSVQEKPRLQSNKTDSLKLEDDDYTERLTFDPKSVIINTRRLLWMITYISKATVFSSEKWDIFKQTILIWGLL